MLWQVNTELLKYECEMRWKMMIIIMSILPLAASPSSSGMMSLCVASSPWHHPFSRLLPSAKSADDDDDDDYGREERFWYGINHANICLILREILRQCRWAQLVSASAVEVYEVNFECELFQTVYPLSAYSAKRPKLFNRKRLMGLKSSKGQRLAEGISPEWSVFVLPGLELLSLPTDYRINWSESSFLLPLA